MAVLGIKALDVILTDLSDRLRRAESDTARGILYHRIDHALERRWKISQDELFEKIRKECE